MGTRVSLGGNLFGLALGPLAAGLLADHAPWPLRLPYVFCIALLVVATILVWRSKETKEHAQPPEPETFAPRLAVPRSIRAPFIGSAVAAFATFSVLGFYSALLPSLLRQSLQISSPAVAGCVVAGLFFVATATLALVPAWEPRRGMIYGLGLLIPATILLVVADATHSLSMLLVATGLGGVASGLGYLFGLQSLNEIAPEDQRAAVVSSYLIVCYAAISLPVVGIGIVSSLWAPLLAMAVFGGIIALVAVAALLFEIFGTPAGRRRHGALLGAAR